MTSPREFLKIKYSAPTDACRCGNCQFVPAEMLESWAVQIDAIAPILEEHELMRKTLETISGTSGDGLQQTQARGALASYMRKSSEDRRGSLGTIVRDEPGVVRFPVPPTGVPK